MPCQLWTLLLLQILFLILFGALCVYGEDQRRLLRSDYGLFQDIHVMIFVGFGFLMAFLKKYSYSSLGFNFLVGALVLQWSILCRGFFNLNEDYKIEIGLNSLYKADVAAAAVLISMGAVLGRTSHIQLVIMGMVEIIIYCVNNWLNERYFKAVDAGGSVTIHTFGAYFGLSVSYALQTNKKTDQKRADLNISEYDASYSSNVYAMIGTIFLWVYWPSFNSIDLEDDRAHRAIVNTYLSLTSSCVTAFIVSQMSSKQQHKFNMVHIQNSTLAGGVAIGACAHLMIQPFGTALLGMIAGAISVYGYSTLSEILETHHLRDTCGINNLHGIPGILGGLTAILLAALANEQKYGITLYDIYPARASANGSSHPEPGDGRSAQQQAGYQAMLLVVTVLLAVASGALSGVIISFKVWGHISPELRNEDSEFWELPPEERNFESSFPITWIRQERLYNNNSNHTLSSVPT